MAKPLMLRIESELDERSATAAINRAQKVYSDAAQEMGRDFSDKLGRGAREGGQAFDEMATRARDAYKRIGAATDDVAEQERVLARMREEGTRGVEVQAERVKAARKRERLAIKEAAAAYDEYEDAAKRAGEAGEKSITGGLQGAAGAAMGAGKDAADNFMGGFAGSSALMRIGAAAGPIGIALAGIGALGVIAGRQLAVGISDGMATLQTQSLFQGRMGLDEASMSQFGSAAGAAYANNWGASVADNLAAAQAALRSGIIDSAATDAEIRTVIEQLQGLTTITDASAQELSRSITTMMRTGMADSVAEASDIIVAGFQNGLDVSGDWLDTINEYSTQFRKLGLDSSQVLTLLSQGLQGGARDTDKVADSLKEFSIRAVDGSKTTREGFEALGFSADEMAAKFAEGGDSAAVALDATLQALKSIDDPMQQALIWQRLFGTQFEDMGDAINRFDLSKVGDEFTDLQGVAERSTKAATDNFKSEWEAATRSVEQYFNDLKTGLADWFTDLPIIRDIPNAIQNMFTDVPFGTPGAPGVPATVGPTSGSGVFGPGIVAGPGFGPAVAPPAGGGSTTVQNPLLAPFTPGALPAPTTAPPGVAAPVPGARTPILTDAQAEQQKELERQARAAGGGSGLPSAPVLPLSYTSTAGMPTAVANAQTRLDEVRHAQAEKEARLNQLLGSNVATAEDIQKARNDLAKAEQDSLQAEQALNDAHMKALDKAGTQMEKQASALESFGASLDSDFGVSKGLSGIAENITKFLMNLAFAPAMGALGAVKQASGFSGGQAGSGLMGMMGSSGAFGSRFMPTPDGYAAMAGMPGMSSLAGLTPSTLRDTGSVASGPQARTAAALVEQQFGHLLRGPIGGSRDTNTAPGTHDAGLSIDIPIGADQMALGDAITSFLQDNSEALGLEYTIWRNQGKYPGGGGFASGGHMDHIDAHFNGRASTYGPGGGSGGLPGSLFQDASGRWRSNLPGWDQLIQRESSGINQVQGITDINSGGNEAEGLFQITPQTWAANGGNRYAPSAISASPQQQAEIATNIFNRNPSGSDWGMGLPGRENPNQLLTELQGGGGRGESPFFGGNGGLGAPAPGRLGAGLGGPLGSTPGLGSAAMASNSVMGGRAWGQGSPASGGASFSGGGILGAAISGAMGAAGAAGGGFGGGAASAAADMGMQLLGRAAGAAGQYAGNAVGGLMETFMLNDSALADPSSSWAGRLLGAATGVRPALPNSAGEMGGEQNPNMVEGGKEPPGPLSPEQAALHDKAAAAGKGGEGGGTTINNNINTTVNKATEDQTGRMVQAHLNAGQAAVQAQR